jgi:hypothetical protein
MVRESINHLRPTVYAGHLSWRRPEAGRREWMWGKRPGWDGSLPETDACQGLWPAYRSVPRGSRGSKRL